MIISKGAMAVNGRLLFVQRIRLAEGTFPQQGIGLKPGDGSRASHAPNNVGSMCGV